MDKFKFVLKDFEASIVVFLIALPLCLGISLASGAPLFAGILAGILGGIVVGSFSKSHTSVSGPAAGLTVIVLAALENLGDFYIFTLAVFIAGILQILMGLFKAGTAGGFFPNSVIKGMLAAIGLILILKQIPHFVGFDQSIIGDDAFFQKDGLNTFSEIAYAFNAINIAALAIGLISIISMIFWDKQAKSGKKFFQFLPSPLLAVLIGITLNEFVFIQFDLFNLEREHFVVLPDGSGLSSFFSSLKFPQWEALTNVSVYKTALTLAIVASLETLLSVEAVDKLDPHKRVTDKNNELVAQGIGNTVAGLVGALPLTSVIVRSSANIAAGSFTKLSAILHGIWIFLAVVFIPTYIEKIPLASLAAVLIMVGFKLCSPNLIKDMLKHGKDQFIPFAITVTAIVFTDLLMGIFIGMIAGFYFVLKASSSKAIVVVNNDSDFLVRFMKDVSFLQKPLMTKILAELPMGSSVIIDGSNPFKIDNDIIIIIEDFLSSCEEKRIKCEIIKSPAAMNKFFKE